MAIFLLFDCQKKNDFLNQKPSTSLVVPTTLNDFQALLDNDNPNSVGVMYQSPRLAMISADDYYLTYAAWQSISIDVVDYNGYVWAKDIYQGQTGIADWNIPYKQIFYSNVALDGLKSIAITSTNQQQWNNVEGSALFLRANAFYNLSQIFCSAYDSITANSDLGLPLKLTSDINEIVQRSTVDQTYQRIILDLKNALQLVATNVTASNTGRPSRPAVYALLAKVYLSMREYSLAGLYADSCLKVYNNLLDYNTIKSNNYSSLKTPINTEIIYQYGVTQGDTYVYLLYDHGFSVDTTLYGLYNDPSDLRIPIYFIKNSPTSININMGYNNSEPFFNGLATDEIYLIRAESFARSGNSNAAINDLDTLLINRWKKGTFVPIISTSPSDALSKVLLERRRELILRGSRWTDLRRLNKEGYNITLTRYLNGQTFTLLPNSPLYILPIPSDEISESGIRQNPR
jgi:hypothetical protein